MFNLDSVVFDQIISKDNYVAACIRNPKSFGNTVLRRSSKGISFKAARCLQCLCTTVFYETVALSFVKHYTALKEASNSLCSDYFVKNKRECKDFAKVLKYYRHVVFVNDFKKKNERDSLTHHTQRIAFQEKFGYFLFAMYLLPRKAVSFVDTAANRKSNSVGKAQPASALKKSYSPANSKVSAPAASAAGKATRNLVDPSNPGGKAKPAKAPINSNGPANSKFSSTSASFAVPTPPPLVLAPNVADEIDPGVFAAFQRSFVCLVKDLTDDLRNEFKDLQRKYDDLRLQLDDYQLKQREADLSVGKLRSQVSLHQVKIEQVEEMATARFSDLSQQLEEKLALHKMTPTATNNTNAFASVEDAGNDAIKVAARAQTITKGQDKYSRRKVAAKTVNLASAASNAAASNAAAISNKRPTISTNSPGAASKKRKNPPPHKDLAIEETELESSLPAHVDSTSDGDETYSESETDESDS